MTKDPFRPMNDNILFPAAGSIRVAGKSGAALEHWAMGTRMIWFLASAATLCAPQSLAGDPPDAPVLTEHPIVARQITGIHNAWSVSPRVVCGGQPASEQAFAELARLGLLTLVSVDGLTPQAEIAKRYGLRYVHIPIGYDGIDSQAAAALTRVAREIKGGIFVHCHHGQHRGPAATAVLCRADDGRSAAAARNILEKAGTGREFAGLWRDVEHYQPPDPSLQLPELVERATVQSLAASMAKIDRLFDELSGIPNRTTDMEVERASFVRSSALLREEFSEAARGLSDSAHPGLREGLLTAHSLAASLAKDLASPERSVPSNIAASTARRTITLLQQSCSHCHSRFRNGPSTSE